MTLFVSYINIWICLLSLCCVVVLPLRHHGTLSYWTILATLKESKTTSFFVGIFWNIVTGCSIYWVNPIFQTQSLSIWNIEYFRIQHVGLWILNSNGWVESIYWINAIYWIPIDPIAQHSVFWTWIACQFKGLYSIYWVVQHLTIQCIWFIHYIDSFNPVDQSNMLDFQKMHCFTNGWISRKCNQWLSQWLDLQFNGWISKCKHCQFWNIDNFRWNFLKHWLWKWQCLVVPASSSCPGWKPIYCINAMVNNINIDITCLWYVTCDWISATLYI